MSSGKDAQKTMETSEGIKVRVTMKRPNEPDIDNTNTKKQKKEKKKEKRDKKDKKLKKQKKKEQNNDDEFDDDSVAQKASAILPKRARQRAPSYSNKEENGLFGKRDFKVLDLKGDHASRPIWVCPDGHIFLETFNPVYRQAYDFLVAIAEPECRSEYIHEYQLTPYSLYAAVSVGLSTQDIISVLNRLSKLKVPKSIEVFIKECTVSYGKVKLVLQKNRYFVESDQPTILQTLLKDNIISTARLKHQSDVISDPVTGLIVSRAPTNITISGGIQNTNKFDPILQNDDLQQKLLEDESDSEKENTEEVPSVHSFEISVEKIESVKKRCIELDYPMLEEYDFKNDTSIPDLAIDLKPTTKVRPYQEKSLSKMFGNGRARSGIIVLPCGAGKTLVGITAAATIKKSTLVLCTSGVSVEQWKYQFKLWSTIEEKSISKFTSDHKEQFSTAAGLTVTTYTMLAFSGKRSKDSQKILDDIQKREWGLVLLDEVHVVPANMFRKVLTVVQAHCKLGLTATLVREDEKIGDLNFLIGPKLYEANWLDLQKAGHIANVQCVEVWCPMSPEFFHDYLNTDSNARKMLLYVMNPIKFRNCQFLINYHERRGDKIIVFSDNIFALREYATKLGKYFIYGPTSGTERMDILHKFQHSNTVNTIFISKVGDTSIDLPEANVIIQISSHYGSRRQEAQRLGRILRPKAKSEDEYNAFFYSLVSKDTQEMYYSTKRQQFLIDQGYAFKVVSDLPLDTDDQLFYNTREERLQLLAKVANVDEKEGTTELLQEDPDDLFTSNINGNNKVAVKRTASTGRALSGASNIQYSEQRTVNSSSLLSKRPAQRNPLLKERFKKN